MSTKSFETSLKVRKAIEFNNHNQSALKVRMGTSLNHNQTTLKVCKGWTNHNQSALKVK